MTDATIIFEKIFAFVPNKPVSLYQIVYGTRLNVKTVKKYLALIEHIQSSKKLVKEIRGSRVLFNKE